MSQKIADMAPLFFVIAGLITLIYFLYQRNKVMLMFFQQEGYDGKRYLGWWARNKAFDIRASALLGVSLVYPPLHFMAPLGPLWGGLISRKYLKTAKKPLVMTERAKRIFHISLILTVVYWIAIDRLIGREMPYWYLVFVLIGLQLPPFTILCANLLLSPAEKRVKNKFRQEAVDKLAQLNPTIVALTGSYGKTSTKHILHHILSAANPTLMTPGSVNTEMGITRIVRENLKPEHDYFIVEMGAYGPGSIARLCRLTPPHQGVITAVGMAHYERFKSVDTVFGAKFELAEAVHQAGGTVTVHTDAIPERLLKPRLEADSGDYLLVGDQRNGYQNGIDLLSVTEKPDGLHLTIKLNGGYQQKPAAGANNHSDGASSTVQGQAEDSTGAKTHQVFVPIYGTMQADNIICAIGCALSLGYPMPVIKAALKDMPQTRHRLEYTPPAGRAGILDDAFNSNPVGFEAALDTLSVVTPEGGRRILITPGMVELGERHDHEHHRLGTLAAKNCDIVLVITPDRIPAFINGIEEAEGQNKPEVMTFETQQAGQDWLNANAGALDVILYENNLPDLFEQRIVF